MERHLMSKKIAELDKILQKINDATNKLMIEVLHHFSFQFCFTLNRKSQQMTVGFHFDRIVIWKFSVGEMNVPDGQSSRRSGSRLAKTAAE